MKGAAVALTKGGKELLVRLREAMPELTLYIPEKLAEAGDGCEAYDGPLRDFLPRLWEEYDGLLLVMALGIVVRLLGPLAADKSKDPAVVVMDEGGRFAISVLSGHLGGANDWARRVAGLTGAQAVITTATDVRGLTAPDVLARQRGWALEPLAHLKSINGAMVNGELIKVYADPPWAELPWPTEPMENYRVEERIPVILVTDRLVAPPEGPHLFLRPRTLTAGLGCRKGVPAEAVLQALAEGCRMAGRSLLSVRAVHSAWVKEEEGGLREAARRLGIPFITHDKEAIAGIYAARDDLEESSFVAETIGVKGVCEAAALLAWPKGKLVLKKTAFGPVTVALAEG